MRIKTKNKGAEQGGNEKYRRTGSRRKENHKKETQNERDTERKRHRTKETQKEKDTERKRHRKEKHRTKKTQKGKGTEMRKNGKGKRKMSKGNRHVHKEYRGAWKRGCALLLAAGLTIGVIGCGKSGDGASDNKDSSQTAQTGSSADMQSTAETAGNYYEGEYEEIPEEGSIGEIAVSGKDIYYMTWDEEYVTHVRKYDTESKETTEVSLPLAEGESIEGICVNSEGNLVIYKVNWTTSDGAAGQTPYWICAYKPDSSVIFEKEITEVLEGSELPYLYHMEVGKDDRIAFSNGKEVWIADKEGNIEFSVPSDNFINEMGVLPDGSFAVSVYEGEAQVIKVLDAEKKDWGDTYKSDRFGWNVKFVQDTEGGLYFWNPSELISFDAESGEAKTVANWIGNSVFSDDIQYVSVLEDESLRIISSDSTGNGGGTELALLKKADAKKAVEKQTLTLGTIELNSGMRKAVISFNKASEKYRVEVIEYGNGVSEEAGVTRFKNEITAGNMPDIVNITDGTEEFYAAKGLLEDLKPYLDGDSGINREDYFANILTAMETDGKMYAVSPEFYIDTMVGKTENVGEGFNWTLEDMMKLEESREAGVEMFDHETKAGVLDAVLQYNMAQFFDLNKGVCDFTGDDFKKILEFCNRFPKENEYLETDASAWRKASDGSLLLMHEGITSMRDYQMCHNIFGTDISFVGYPSDTACGSVAKGGQMTLAMNAKCADKEAAWEFIRYFLEEDYQLKYTVYLPLLKAAFDKKAKEEMKATYTEENGEKIEVSTLMIGTSDFTLELFAAKEEEVEAIRTLIEKIERMERIDEQVLSIIEEEAGAYFEGQKSVDDVVQIIQNRANIYMNENR